MSGDRDLAMLFPVVRTLIDRHSVSTDVRNALAKHLSDVTGAPVSHKTTNKLLSQMVDECILYRVSHGKAQFYAYNGGKSLRSVTTQGEPRGNLD